MKKWSFYKIKKLVDKHFQRYERDFLIKEYLIQWKKYESKYDEWYDEDLLNNASKLIVNYNINHSDSNTLLKSCLDHSIKETQSWYVCIAL